MKSDIFNSILSAGTGGAIVHQATVGDWGAVGMLAFGLAAWMVSCVADKRRGM